MSMLGWGACPVSLVLGVKCGGNPLGNGHDCNAALVGSGQLIAIQSERFDRIRKSAGWRRSTIVNRSMSRSSPQFVGSRTAVGYCLAGLGVAEDDVELVVVDDLGGWEEQWHELGAFTRRGTQAVRIRHHLAHAASAFLCSPFEEATVLVFDGGGGKRPDGDPFAYERQSAFVGTGNRIRHLWTTWGNKRHIWGLGGAYAVHESVLGMEAGKVMGLAGYGKPNPGLRTPVFVRYGRNVYMNPALLQDSGPDNFVASADNNAYGRVREWDEDPTVEPWPDIAYKAQEELEEQVLHLARCLHKQTQLDNLCLAGGVALNGLANYRLMTEGPFRHLFIQPAADDKGIGLGCALYGFHSVLDKPRHYIMKHAYLGRVYSDGEVMSSLRQHRRSIEWRSVDVIRAAAQCLARNEIIAWFQGGSEYGPRALGHRSLLCRADSTQLRDRMNKLKHRELWRPLAPCVLNEHSARFFGVSDSPFMLLIPRATPSGRRAVPGVVHVDDTARLQTVDITNGLFCDLLRCFHDLAGCPVLINTSFNLAGEPIVETPDDAIDTFVRAEQLDALFLQGYQVTRRKPQ